VGEHESQGYGSHGLLAREENVAVPVRQSVWWTIYRTRRFYV